MAERKLEIQIVGDSRSLERAFGRASSSSGGLGRSLKTLGKVAAVGVGAAFAGLAVALKVGFDELAEGQLVAAQTSAVLKSTGAAANVTAKEVDDLSMSLSRMSGVDDELIGKGQNMLLTFTNVRDEVGKGNDVFSQATKTMLDMSVATGRDMAKSAVTMGKALNDPISGMSTLTRIGVKFTDAQKKQVKAMVEAGDVMGAQKLILAELNTRFAGSAKAAGETFPMQLAKLKNAFAEAAAGLAEILLPYLIRFANWVNGNMPKIEAGFRTLGDIISAAFGVIGPVIMNVVVPGIQRMVELGKDIVGVYGRFKGVIEPITAALLVLTAAIVAHVLYVKIASAATEKWAKIQQVLNAVMSANPILKIAVLLLALGAALVVAYQRSETFRRIVQGALDAVRGAAQTVVAFFTGTVAPAFTAAWSKVSGAVTAAWNLIRPILGAIKSGVQGMVDLVVGIFTGDWARAWSGLKASAQAGWTLLKTWIWTLPAKMAGWAMGIGGALVDGIKNGIAAGWDALLAWAEAKIDSLPWVIKKALGIASPSAVFAEIGRNTVEGMIEGFRQMAGKLGEAAEGMANTVIDKAVAQIEARGGALASALSSLVSAASSAFDQVTAQETASEAKLRKMEEARAEAARKKALADAEAGVWAAVVSGDPEEYKRAMQALADAQYEIEKAGLEKRAAQERRKRDEQRAAEKLDYDRRLAQLNANLASGRISYEQWFARLRQLMKDYEVPFGKGAGALGAAVAKGLRLALGDVEKASAELLDAIVKQFRKIRLVVSVSVVGDGSASAPGRASGGPVRRGSPYMVGERGPELFVPSSSGVIVPNGASRSSGGGTTVVVNVGGSVVSEQNLVEAVRRGLQARDRRNVTGSLTLA
jgi:hypothetical protein